MQSYLKILSVALGILALTACASKGAGDGEQVSTGTDFDFSGMAINYADNVAIPAYQDAVQKQSDLREATDAYCQSLVDGSDVSSLNFPQQQWLAMMQAWQRVELLHVGPLAENDFALRNEIHPYNVKNVSFSACSIDISVAKLNADPELDIKTRPLGARGLAALEYIFFNSELTHNCPSQIADTVNWNDLDELERVKQRCQYAETLNKDIHASLVELMIQWSANGENYRSKFINPSNINTTLKEMSDALYYIEKETKDAKLGIPLSLKLPGCSKTACPELVESPTSKTSLQNIKTNLLAFQTALKGGSGLGFDDLLEHVGAGYLVNEFDALIAEAIAIIDGDERSYFEQSSELLAGADLSVCKNAQAAPDVEGGIPVCRLHGVLKQITDRLRMEFSTAVNIDLPTRAGGDGD